MELVPVPACFEQCGMCRRDVNEGDPWFNKIFGIHDKGQVQISQALSVIVDQNPFQARNRDTSSQALQRAVFCNNCHFMVTALYNMWTHVVSGCAPDTPAYRYIEDTFESRKSRQVEFDARADGNNISSSEDLENVEGAISQPGASDWSQSQFEDGEDESIEEQLRNRTNSQLNESFSSERVYHFLYDNVKDKNKKEEEEKTQDPEPTPRTVTVVVKETNVKKDEAKKQKPAPKPAQRPITPRGPPSAKDIHQCGICDKVFVGTSGFLRHCKSVHHGKFVVKCTFKQCQQGACIFLDLDEFRKHNVEMHGGKVYKEQKSPAKKQAEIAASVDLKGNVQASSAVAAGMVAGNPPVRNVGVGAPVGNSAVVKVVVKNGSAVATAPISNNPVRNGPVAISPATAATSNSLKSGPAGFVVRNAPVPITPTSVAAPVRAPVPTAPAPNVQVPNMPAPMVANVRAPVGSHVTHRPMGNHTAGASPFGGGSLESTFLTLAGNLFANRFGNAPGFASPAAAPFGTLPARAFGTVPVGSPSVVGNPTAGTGAQNQNAQNASTVSIPPNPTNAINSTVENVTVHIQPNKIPRLCGYCGTRYSRRDHLKNHCNKIHPGQEYISQCVEPGCKEQFRGSYDSKDLQLHRATAHGIGTVEGAGAKKRVRQAAPVPRTQQETSAAEAPKRGRGRPRKFPKMEEDQSQVVGIGNHDEEMPNLDLNLNDSMPVLEPMVEIRERKPQIVLKNEKFTQ